MAFSLELGKVKALPIPYNTQIHFIQEVAVLFWAQSIPTTHKAVTTGIFPIAISLSCVAYGGLEFFLPGVS